MTTSSSNLGLTLYNMITDGSTLFYNFVGKISGSDPSSDMQIIDEWSGSVSGSLAWMSGSLAWISASLIAVYNITSTSYVGTASQITAGSADNILVSASSLSQSAYGKRSAVIPLNTSNVLSGSEINYIRIPSSMDGWVLVDAQASCSGSPHPGSPSGGTSGCPSFAVYKSNPSSASLVAMLSTNITIDEGEYDSSTAKAPSVISTTASSVFTGTRIKVMTESEATSGSNVTYAQVSLTFQNKP